jgi:hypothetical protein
MQSLSVDVVDRLRMIKGLCREIATRLEDEASVQTIPRNYEYDGRRTALLEIAGEIDIAVSELEKISDPERVHARVRALFAQVEARKQHNLEEQERNKEFQHNFRMSQTYFTPRGAIAGCEKVLEWLREALKYSEK